MTISSPGAANNSGSVILRQHGWPKRNFAMFGYGASTVSARSSASACSQTRQTWRAGTAIACMAATSATLSAGPSVIRVRSSVFEAVSDEALHRLVGVGQ